MEQRGEYDMSAEYYGGITPDELAECRKLLRLLQGVEFAEFVRLIETAAGQTNSTVGVIFKGGRVAGVRFETYRSLTR